MVNAIVAFLCFRRIRAHAHSGTEMTDSLSDRIRRVLDEKRVDNARQWSRAAGLSDQHVSTFLDRAAKSPTADVGARVLFALAAAAKVDPRWLATGVGEPDLETPDETALQAVRRMGRAQGFPESFLSEWMPREDLLDATAEELWTTMRAAHLGWARDQTASPAERVVRGVLSEFEKRLLVREAVAQLNATVVPDSPGETRRRLLVAAPPANRAKSVTRPAKRAR